MHIDVIKLSRAGWDVEIDRDGEHITIRPLEGNPGLFDKVASLVAHPDLGLDERDCHQLADKFVSDVQKQQLWKLME